MDRIVIVVKSQRCERKKVKDRYSGVNISSTCILYKRFDLSASWLHSFISIITEAAKWTEAGDDAKKMDAKGPISAEMIALQNKIFLTSP